MTTNTKAPYYILTESFIIDEEPFEMEEGINAVFIPGEFNPVAYSRQLSDNPMLQSYIAEQLYNNGAPPSACDWLNKWCGSVLLSDDWDVFGEQEEEYINKGLIIFYVNS